MVTPTIVYITFFQKSIEIIDTEGKNSKVAKLI